VVKAVLAPEKGQPPMPNMDPARKSRAASLVSTTIDRATSDLLDPWRAFSSSSPTPMHNPEWLNGYFAGQRSNLQVYALFESGSLAGVAPFLRRDWPLKWHLGEWCVATFPLRRLRLLGGQLAFPEDEASCDLLFRRVLSEGGFDAVFIEEVPVDSFFWKYLHSSRLIRESFLLYQPDRVSPHPVLRIEGTFENYMGKFSSKHRKNLKRNIRKLREAAADDLRLLRYESPEEVSKFLDIAVDISRKTYQWQLHQRGLSATALLRERLSFAAAQGWMRSYLLYCGEQAVAFGVGYQYNGTFLLDEIGHDPEWSKHSAGTVLQLLMVEDLFNYNRARVFDLQDYAWYKDELANENYLQGRMFLFRRGAYSCFLTAGHRVCSAVTLSASAALEKMGLKSKVRKLIRRVGSRTEEGAK